MMRTTAPLMSLSDVAALTRVRRPVVTTWRRRITVGGVLAPFPDAVEVDAGVELFDADDVIGWLRRTGRGNNAEPSADLYAHVRMPTVSADGASGHDAVEALLCLMARSGEMLGDLDPEDVVDLADATDPDDTFLYREVQALKADLPRVARFVDRLVDAAYGPIGALARLERRRPGALDAAPIALTPAARAVVGEAGAALGLDLGSASLVVSDPTGAADDLVEAVVQALGERIDVSICVPPGDASARSARRAHLIRGWSLSGAPDAGDGVLAVARFPHPHRPVMSAGEILTAVDDVQLELGQQHRAVVLGPASILCDALRDAELERTRDRLLRLGRLRCAVRLPKGLVPGKPRQALGLWILGPEMTGVPPESRLVSTADLSDEQLSEDVIGDLVTDVVASLVERRGRAHAFRFARLSHTAALLAGRGALVPEGVRPKAVERVSSDQVVHLRTLVARIGPDGLWDGLRIEVGEHPASTPWVPLASALADGSARVGAGVRVDRADLGHTGVRIITADDLGAPEEALRMDPLLAAQRHPRAALTEPGDVVFCTTPRPRAIVDREGLAVVAYPARVLRCAPDAGLLPEALAWAINSRPEASREWRTWLVPRIAAEQVAPLRDALRMIAGEQEAARTRAADLQTLARTLVEGTASGAVAIETAPPRISDKQPHLTSEGQ